MLKNGNYDKIKIGKGKCRVKNRLLYVVFSATPLKMGSMIRSVTREKYNHVSISFDPELKTLYSFARHYKNAPLYGGFVRETPARYKNNGKIADIFVCALPITENEFLETKEQIKMLAKSKSCHYNMFSAATSIISHRVFIKNCYTCAEFAVNILSGIVPEISENGFYGIEDLRQILKDYEIYSGKFPDVVNESDPDYEREITLPDLFYYTVKGEVELIKAIAQK